MLTSGIDDDMPEVRLVTQIPIDPGCIDLLYFLLIVDALLGAVGAAGAVGARGLDLFHFNDDYKP